MPVGRDRHFLSSGPTTGSTIPSAIRTRFSTALTPCSLLNCFLAGYAIFDPPFATIKNRTRARAARTRLYRKYPGKNLPTMPGPSGTT